MEATPCTSTLLSTEMRLRPFVLTTIVLCPAIALLAFWHTIGLVSTVLWSACVAGAIIPTYSNLRYLRTHTLTTVGMIPVACSALLPAVLTGALAQGIAPVASLSYRATLALLCALVTIFVWWFVRLRRTYQAHPDITDDAALVVLGGAIKRGRPCETLALRLDVAARLWEEQPTRTIVVTGGPTPDGTTTEAQEMSRYLVERGVSGDRILLEPKARNTQENIACSLALLDASGVRGQRCIVSSDYHLWRALRDARALGTALTPIAAPTPHASVPQQWCREVLTILSGR